MHRLLAILVVCLGPAAPSVAAEIFVPSQAATIQAAVELAAPGDEIIVTPGTWTGSIDLLGKAITLRSRDGASVTTIAAPAGARSISCISGEARTTLIEGFRIEGGGLAIVGAGPTVRGCRFSNITWNGDGGGVHGTRADPLLDDCRFTSTSTTGAGGGAYFTASAPELRRCRFSGNGTGLDGGGLCADGGTQALVIDCRFQGNLAGANGGAVAVRGASTVTIVNGLITNNTAEFNGGAVYGLGGSLSVVTGATLVGNAAGFDGGAIYNQGGSTALLSGSILRASTPNGIADVDVPSVVSHCNIQGGWRGAGGDNFDLDPQFIDVDEGDYRIAPDSPCVDAGDGAAGGLEFVDLDLAGRPRVVDGDADGTATIDVGAYEHQVLDNDNCADAIDVVIGTVSTTTFGATTDGTAHDWCGFDLGSDIWFRFVAPCDAQVTADVAADGFQPFVALYPTGCPAPGQPPVLCGSGPGMSAAVSSSVVGGAVYHYRVGGTGGAQGAITFTLSGADCPPIPTNDTCGNAITVALGSIEFTTLGATTDGPNELATCGSPGPDKDIWYRWFSTCNEILHVSLCESDYDSSIVIYGPSCPGVPGEPLACNDDFEPCGDGARVSLEVEAPQLYRIRVGGFDGDAGHGVMNLSCAPIPACTTDTNGDGVTDIDDLVNVILDFGTDGSAHGGDVNGDGTVNIDDPVLTVLAFGPCAF